MKPILKTLSISLFISVLTAGIVQAVIVPQMPSNGTAKPAQKTVKKEVKSSDQAWERYRDSMIQISKQMGVTCTYCHDTKNYRDNAKPTFKMAKQHMEMVDMLNAKFKTAFSEKVDCYMCHRGLAKPDYQQKPEKF